MPIVHKYIDTFTKCRSVLWKALTKTMATDTTQFPLQQAKNVAEKKHYRRSLHGIIHYYYRNSVTFKEAELFVKEFPKLKKVGEFQLEYIITLIKNDGHCWKEVKSNKFVLLLSPAHYRQRNQLLQSLSMTQPTLYYILTISSLMYITVNSLKKRFKNTFEADPLEQLIASSTNLNLPKHVIQGAHDLSRSNDSVTLKDLFTYLIKHYLSIRFSEDTGVVESWLNSVQLIDLWRPLNTYPQICDVLTYSFELSFSKVRKHPSLFSLDIKDITEILNKFPSIGGTPIKEIATAVPKLLFLPVPLLETWLVFLHKQEVYQFTCTNHTIALFKTNSFCEVAKRLDILKQLQEWEIIMISNYLFEILRSHECVKKLLNIIESGEVISKLCTAIRSNKSSPPKHCCKVTSEIVTYISTRLGVSLNEAKEILTEEIHTSHGMNNIKAVLNLLLEFGFTREQVMMGAAVLNLEVGVVEETLMDLHNKTDSRAFAEWMDHPFIIQLVAYYVKRNIPDV